MEIEGIIISGTKKAVILYLKSFIAISLKTGLVSSHLPGL